MQKPIGGLSVLTLSTPKNQSAYKWDYTTTEQQNKHNPFPKPKIRAKQKHIATRGQQPCHQSSKTSSPEKSSTAEEKKP
jgi:hypothetical protein